MSEDASDNLESTGGFGSRHTDLAPREADLAARALILRAERVPRFFAEGRFLQLAALAEYLEREVPHQLAHTDPALYRSLREGVTKLHLMGFGTLNAEVLREAAAKGFRFRRDDRRP
jgi:hypothetical protein